MAKTSMNLTLLSKCPNPQNQNPEIMSSLARYCHRAFQFRKSQRFQLKTISFFSSHPAVEAPIRVGLTESAGRSIFASRGIGVGNLIHTAQPVVSHPSLSMLGHVCYFCLRKLPNSTETPQTTSFCCEQCEKQSESFYRVEKMADWSRFHDYCRVQGLKYPLLVKRLTCQVLSGSVSSDVLDILQPESLSSAKLLQMKNEVALLRGTLEDTEIESENLAFITEEWYAAVLARVRINAFRIELAGGSYEDLLSLAAALVEAEAAVGNAVYMVPSFYNHDCDPNVNIVWIDNVDAKLYALRDIEEGEELRICYIDASMDFEARQTILYQGFGFQCNCLRCLSKD